MALTGQLSDMSLAELIEFFCNQRKTGRLKIDYPRGHSVFFIKEGELVDAKVGALSGPEAVYFSLTLPNAAFDFSPDVQATRRTIHQAWTQVVLEGLRRLDEGLSPTEADAFGKWEPSESELAQMLDQVEHLDTAQAKSAGEKKRAARAAAPDASAKDEEAKESPAKENSPEPFSMMVESASAEGGSKKKFVLLGVAAAVVLACAVAAVPLLNRAPAKAETEAADAPAAAAPAEPAPAEPQPAEASGDAAAPTAEENAEAAADAARREERERKERERRRREEAAKREEAANALNPTDPAAAKPATPSGPKSVRVTVTYDEAGRVTAASVAGATPGAEAYGSTAVRIARGKRFPAGKPGSTVVTIPVN
jgi:TonB family protein